MYAFNENYVFIEGATKSDADIIKNHYEVIDVREEKNGALFELYDDGLPIDPSKRLSGLFPDKVVCVNHNSGTGELHFDAVLNNEKYTDISVSYEEQDDDADIWDTTVCVNRNGVLLTEFPYGFFDREYVEDYFGL